MKGKMKKMSVGALSLGLMVALTPILSGCSGPTSSFPNSGDSNSSITQPGEAVVTELSIDTPPNRTEYYIGEVFDSTGMKVKARWSDGVKLMVPLNECTFDPAGPLESGTTAITVTYKGKSATQPIRIIDEKISSISVDTGNTVLRAAVNTPIDLSGIKVTARYADGSERLLSGGYTFEVDGEEVKDVSALTFAEWGKHIVKVIYGDLSSDITLTIFDGFIVEAENMIDEPTEEDRNYVEIYKRSPAGGPSKITKPGEPASGGSYMGAVFNGSVMRFHVYAEEACNADVILRASSANMLQDGGAWSPIEMGDQQFNRLFDINYGSAEDANNDTLKELRVGDDVILEGGSTDNPQGDPMLYVNWKDVNFGTLALEKGDNVIELTVITDYINCRQENVACNIDRLEIQYTEDDPDETITVESLSITTPPSKTTYMAGEKFDPAGMVIEALLSNKTTEVIDISKCTITPSSGLTTSDNSVTITYRGKSVVQPITVNAAESITIEGEEIIAEPTSEDRNYVEVMRNGYQGVVSASDTEAPGEAETSGGKYLKGLFGAAGEALGAMVRFHIYSEVDCEAEIKLSVSSCNVLESGDGNPWHPSKMGDVQFNNIFKVRFGTSDNLQDVSIGDDVIVEGGEMKEGWSFFLYENWRDISLGTLSLKAGDNIVELENINSTLTNLAGEIQGLNVDKLTVDFK